MRNTQFPLRGSGKLLIAVLALTLIALQSCDDKKTTEQEAQTETTTTPATTFAPGDSLQYPLLRIDSVLLVDSFYEQPEPFKKILFTYTVKNPTTFPQTLTLKAQGSKQNGDLLGYDPEELTITDSLIKLPADLDLPTLEISKQKLANLVGQNGGANGRRYTHILFIPYVETKNNVKYLSYRLVVRPALDEGDEASENLNPCPPYKPD